jgi:hypothetical protein
MGPYTIYKPLKEGIENGYRASFCLHMEKEGDHFLDQLNKMWVQEQPRGAIDVLEDEQWDTFNGTYLKRTEFAKLMEC